MKTSGNVSPVGLIHPSHSFSDGGHAFLKKRLSAAAATFRRWSDSEIVGVFNYFKF